MKKIIAILTIIMVFILPFSVTFNEQKAHANIISKPLTITAKKVAKELAQNSAVEMAEHILFEKAMADFLATDMTDPGYKAVCLDGAKSYDDCPANKRAQVKETLTSSDKSKLSSKVEQVLEQKTNTSSKWTKFLDWFVPIFLISGLVASFDAMLDPDSEGLIDDIALEALTDTGLIKPLLGSTSGEAFIPKDFAPYIQSVKVENKQSTPNQVHSVLTIQTQVGKSFILHYGSNKTTINGARVLTLTSIAGWQYVEGNSKLIYPYAETSNFHNGFGNYTLSNHYRWRGEIMDLTTANKDIAVQQANANLHGYFASWKSGSQNVNDILNTWFGYLNTLIPVKIEVADLEVPPVVPDYGTQTGLQHIKNPDGTVKTPGIESFKYTYNNTYIYPSPDSTTGWKDKATDIDIAVVEDDVVVDGGEPPIDPEAPPAEDDDINTDKDKDKIKKKSRDWSALLTTRFPFSLPWDFLHLMKFLYAEPMTPHWEIKGTEKVPFNLKMDLKFMEPYAPWFRTFIFLSFVMSVIFLHGRFMGGSK